MREKEFVVLASEFQSQYSAFFLLGQTSAYVNAMNFTVCGCGMSFKASGLRCHQRQSLDIRCQTKRPLFDNSESGCDNCDMRHIWENMDIIEDTGGAEYTELEVDPAGDLFGDYQDYILDDMGTDCLDSNVSDDESEGTIDEEEFILTDNHEMLEPERLPSSEYSLSSPSPDVVNFDETDLDPAKNTIGKASRLRGGAEEVLQKQPFVVKFTKGRAGETYSNQQADGEDNLNTSYTRKVANAENAENIYGPFSSKLEWEFAHWAKMRGPSSTAFDELMKIKGVSIINFQAATH